MYGINAKKLGKYDVIVCGGGIAGACAAISAAREGASVLLVEKAGSLGGTLTEGFMPIILDSQNKGGLVRELYSFLDEHGMSCARNGSPIDENGKRIPGIMVDTEGCKYFFDKTCTEAGVRILFHSQIVAVDMEEDKIRGVLICTDCGSYTASAEVYIDASGNGVLADLAGCKWECGEPTTGAPSPASMSTCVIGMPNGYAGTEKGEDKTAYGNMLAERGIHPSSEQVSVRMLPSLKSWTMGLNFEYDVVPDDIKRLSDAVISGRREAFEVIDKHREIEGYSELSIAFTGAHIGIREGRRIFGEYRITDEDILTGRRFEDGLCLVTFGVDVHKLHATDTTDCKRGYRSQPYNIPYRALVPLGVSNMLLAGRCISGDFYPHASYRVMGNMAATGEAAGFAAANIAREGITPRDFDGRRAKEFMMEKGYAL